MTMFTTPPASMPRVRRRRVRPVTSAAVFVALILASGCSDDDDGGDTSGPDPSRLMAEVGTLPDARAIMEKTPYETARWIYYVADAESGEVLLANRADEMVFTGSTAKNFVVGTVYDTLGPDTTLTTPVFSTTPAHDGVVAGDLVLVASGDLAVGGRNGLEGRFDHTFGGSTVDHVYANIAPNAARVGDPLAGLDNLAQQIAAAGVTRVDGDILIDTSVWETFVGQADPTPSIFVNDNILDLEVTAVGDGEAATIEAIPATDYVTIEADVTTVAADGDTVLAVDASADDPNTVVVSGTIAEGTSQLTICPIEDAAAWARALFIEALERAGVAVEAPADGPNDQSGLPAADSYPADQQVASLESPPLSAMGTMINEVSYNNRANAFMCCWPSSAGRPTASTDWRPSTNWPARPGSTPTTCSWSMARAETRRRRHRDRSVAGCNGRGSSRGARRSCRGSRCWPRRARWPPTALAARQPAR